MLAPHGLRFVSAAGIRCNLLDRSVEDEIAADRRPSRPARGDGLPGLHRLRDLERHPRPGRRAAEPQPGADAAATGRASAPRSRRWPRIAPARAADGLSPPHGHRGRDAGGDRLVHGQHRPGDEAAVRHRALLFRRPRRRSGAVLAKRWRAGCGICTAKNVRPAVMAQVRDEDLSFLEAVRRGVFTVPGDAEGGVDFAAVLRLAAARWLCRLAGDRGRAGSGGRATR